MKRYFMFFLRSRRIANIVNDLTILLLFALVIFFIFVVVKNAFGEDITIQWDPSQQTDIDHYEVYIASFISQKQSAAFTKVQDVPADITTYTVTELAEGKAYIFQVYAVNSEGITSLASNIATTQSIVAPDAVLNLRVIPPAP